MLEKRQTSSPSKITPASTSRERGGDQFFNDILSCKYSDLSTVKMGIYKPGMLIIFPLDFFLL
jgi:hypothetical protein